MISWYFFHSIIVLWYIFVLLYHGIIVFKLLWFRCIVVSWYYTGPPREFLDPRAKGNLAPPPLILQIMILTLSPPRCVMSKESVQQKWIDELWFTYKSKITKNKYMYMYMVQCPIHRNRKVVMHHQGPNESHYHSGILLWWQHTKTRSIITRFLLNRFQGQLFNGVW